MLPPNGIEKAVILVPDGRKTLQSRRELSVLPTASPGMLIDHAKLSQAVMGRRPEFSLRFRLRKSQRQQPPEVELVLR